ncbi:hypothetical protein NM688_g4967 [Phlebia brevispora]|uniref:Uncharacterized protein n=1 Tax=Phlebia brevispora TaxID=194682 RepID=A0ACC1T1F8_9APHY|nr:hypothetical protein NM688_g4967 [Phlebia brevispora]
MSMLLRRSLVRAVPRRAFATDVAQTSYLEKQAALRSHAAETATMWRKISFYVCLPAIAVCTLWVVRVEKEHAEHEEHIKAEHGGELPAIPDYEYLNRRAKPFPWGPNSLFFNPKVHLNSVWSGNIILTRLSYAQTQKDLSQ